MTPITWTPPAGSDCTRRANSGTAARGTSTAPAFVIRCLLKCLKLPRLLSPGSGWLSSTVSVICAGWFSSIMSVICAGWFSSIESVICAGWFSSIESVICAGWFNSILSVICAGWFI